MNCDVFRSSMMASAVTTPRVVLQALLDHVCDCPYCEEWLSKLPPSTPAQLAAGYRVAKQKGVSFAKLRNLRSVP